MTKNNSVKTMVYALKKLGVMTENEITKTAFDYDRNNSYGESNKKYADMLRRGMTKGIIDRVEFPPHAIVKGRAKFLYFATRPVVECSSELDNMYANESI